MQICLETLACLSLGVSLRAISQPLVERLGADSLVSDNSAEDIVFTAKLLLTPATRSDNAVTILFQYEHFKKQTFRDDQQFVKAPCGHISEVVGTLNIHLAPSSLKSQSVNSFKAHGL